MAIFADYQKVLFSDGEGLTHNDLNDLALATEQNAWEWPGYAHLLPHRRLDPAGQIFSDATDLDKMVFSVGDGPLFATQPGPLDLQIGEAFLGIYEGSGSPQGMAPAMRWVRTEPVVDLEAAISFMAAPAGQFRYDRLLLYTATVDDTSVARDFKDAATGAYTTSPFNTRRRYRAALTVQQGTPGATPVFPGGTGRAVAMVKVSDSEIVEILDLTYPVGAGRTYVSRPRLDAVIANVEGWEGTSGLLSVARAAPGDPPGSAPNDLLLLPGPFAGDPRARLIGLEVSYANPATLSLRLVRADMAAPATAGAMPALPTSTTLATLDSLAASPIGTTAVFVAAGAQVAGVDLRGDVGGWADGNTSRRGPFWGNGARSRVAHEVVEEGLTGKTLALYVSCLGQARINWVRWHFAKG